MILTTLKNANLALAFFLELGVLAALGYWGFYTGQGTLAKIGLGIGAPAVAGVVWGLFGAPRSAWRLPGLWFFILRVVLFRSAALAPFAASPAVPGAGFPPVFWVNL